MDFAGDGGADAKVASLHDNHSQVPMAIFLIHLQLIGNVMTYQSNFERASIAHLFLIALAYQVILSNTSKDYEYENFRSKLYLLFWREICMLLSMTRLKAACTVCKSSSADMRKCGSPCSVQYSSIFESIFVRAAPLAFLSFSCQKRRGLEAA